jgi:hypothetical protein
VLSELCVAAHLGLIPLRHEFFVPLFALLVFDEIGIFLIFGVGFSPFRLLIFFFELVLLFREIF